MDRADSIAKRRHRKVLQESLGISPSIQKNELKRFEYLEIVNELVYHLV